MEVLLSAPEGQALSARFGRSRAKEALRRAADRFRTGALEDREALFEDARSALASRPPAGPVRVVNATGVLLHTNLGRSPLADEARDALLAAAGFSSLELDLATGLRGRRDAHVLPLLLALFAPGREDLDAAVVNNAAAALLLALDTVANGRPVAVSRGELVAIGGDFRVPSILARSGATLREVGTTNRTTRADYEEALDEGAAALLKVRPSNYRIVGFTEEVPLEELGTLAASRGVPLVFDAGAAAPRRLEWPGLADEPVPVEAIDEGAGLVCFSGDKTLGGPQAGILIGRRELVARARRNPLARALRPDKLAFAALAATLELHLSGREAAVPLYRMLATPLEALERRARTLAAQAAELGWDAEGVPSVAVAGGGTGTEAELPSFAVALRDPRGADVLAAALRRADPPVLARIVRERVLLDLRSVEEEEEPLVLAALAALAAARPG